MARAMDTLDVAFTASREHFDMMVEFLRGEAPAAGLAHARLEDYLTIAGRELLRLLMQGYMDLRAAAEQRLDEVAPWNG